MASNITPRKIFLGLSAIVVLSLQTGCAHYRPKLYTEAPPGQFYLSPIANFEQEAFLAKWSGTVTEQEKIRYLLDRVAISDNLFVRNGETHDGKAARQWLLYKSRHWVTGVGTADNFISRVASFSQKTSQPYLVRVSDGRLYSLRSVLKNELARLNDFLTHVRPLQVTVTKPSELPAAQAPPPLAAAPTR